MGGNFQNEFTHEIPVQKKIKDFDIHLHLEGICKIDSIKILIFIMRYRQTKITSYYRPKPRLFKNRKIYQKFY